MRCAAALSTSRDSDSALGEVVERTGRGVRRRAGGPGDGLRLDPPRRDPGTTRCRPDGAGPGPARPGLHGGDDHRRRPRGRGGARPERLGDPAPGAELTAGPDRRPGRPRRARARVRVAPAPGRSVLVRADPWLQKVNARGPRPPGHGRDGQRAASPPARTGSCSTARSTRTAPWAWSWAAGVTPRTAGQPGLPADRPPDDRHQGRAEHDPRAGPPPVAGSPPRAVRGAPARGPGAGPVGPAHRPGDQRIPGRLPARRLPGPQRDGGRRLGRDRDHRPRPRRPDRPVPRPRRRDRRRGPPRPARAERLDRPRSRVAGALLFTCNGRGTRLFDRPDHDVGVLRELFGPIPVAGFFAMGEIGPVGGQNFVHGFTASVVLFEETPD